MKDGVARSKGLTAVVYWPHMIGLSRAQVGRLPGKLKALTFRMCFGSVHRRSIREEGEDNHMSGKLAGHVATAQDTGRGRPHRSNAMDGSRLQRTGTRAFLAVVLIMALIPGVALSSRSRPIGGHRLGSDAAGVAFQVVRMGGLFPPAGVTVYNDGRVAASGGARLQNSQLTLTSQVLEGLVKLAEAEAFFSMPATKSCATRETDVRVATVTVDTQEKVWTVSVPTVCRASSFDQLYGVLVAVTESSLGP